MTKRIKNLSVLTVAVLAGLFVTFSALNIQANEILNNSGENVSGLMENSTSGVIPIFDNFVDNKCGEGKCGEGKCGGATKEVKKETKKEGAVKAEKSEKNVKTTEEGKCGEGKCGGAEKKEGKAEKKESKEAKGSEGKCGQGKCGVA